MQPHTSFILDEVNIQKHTETITTICTCIHTCNHTHTTIPNLQLFISVCLDAEEQMDEAFVCLFAARRESEL